MTRLWCRWLRRKVALAVTPTADDVQQEYNEAQEKADIARRLEDAKHRLRMLEWEADVASRKRWPVMKRTEEPKP